MKASENDKFDAYITKEMMDAVIFQQAYDYRFESEKDVAWQICREVMSRLATPPKPRATEPKWDQRAYLPP
jgi:hypothetical protein